MYRLEFILFGLPKMANRTRGQHFRVYMKHRDEWAQKVHGSIAGKLPEEPLKRARIELTRFSSIEPDFDGLVSSFKAILDALRGRVILDDRPSCIGSPLCKWEKTAPKQGRIKVIVEEV